jgi:hypothetical protein
LQGTNCVGAGQLLASNVTISQCAALYEPRALEACETVGDTYYMFVKLLGKYDDGQVEAKAAGCP